MLASEVITRARTLLGDQRKQRFSDEELLLEINAILREACSDVGWYRTDAGIPICENRRQYAFPSDFIKLRAIQFDDMIAGSVIVASTYKDALMASGFTNTNNAASYWRFMPSSRSTSSQSVFFKDTVSYNEFVLDPPVSGEMAQPDLSQLTGWPTWTS